MPLISFSTSISRVACASTLALIPAGLTLLQPVAAQPVSTQPVAAQPVAVQPVAAQEIGVDDNLAVAGQVAPDTALYFGVEAASASLRSALDSDELDELQAEYADVLRELLEGEGEASLWAQVVGGDWGLAVSKQSLPWMSAWSKQGELRLRDMVTDGIALPLRLLKGEIDANEYQRAMAERFGLGDSVESQEKMTAAGATGLRELMNENAELPSLAFVIRPSTAAGRDHLALQVEQLVSDYGSKIPDTVTVQEQRIGEFNCRTWNARLGDLGPVGNAILGGDDFEGQMRSTLGRQFSDEEAAQLRDWISSRELMIGYGWDQALESFVIFVGPQADAIPVARAGQSLASAEPGLAELAAAAPAGGSRLDMYSSEEVNSLNYEGAMPAGWEASFTELESVFSNYGNDPRVVTLHKGLGSLREYMPALTPEVTGATVTTFYVNDGSLCLDSLTGLVEQGLDLSEPIAWPQLLDLDAPLVLVGAINPTQIDQSLSLLSSELPAALAWGSLKNEAQQQAAAAEKGEIASIAKIDKFDAWLRTDEGRQAVGSFARLGHRFEEALGTQGAFVLDLDGEVPQWAEGGIEASNLGGFPRLLWAAELKDARKLDGSWEDLLDSGLNMAAQASNGDRPVIPQPVQTSQGEVNSWFFAMQPFTTLDCMPTVSQTDDLFLMGSSLNQQREFAAQVDPSTEPTAEEAPSGRIVRAQVGELARLLVTRESLNQLRKGIEAQGLSHDFNEQQLAPFKEGEQSALKLVNSLGDLTIWERQQDERVRRTVILDFKGTSENPCGRAAK